MNNRIFFFFFAAYFSGVVKVLYNLLYYQVILQISCNFSRAERNTILKRRRSCAATSSEAALAEIIEFFRDSGLYSGTDDDKPSTSASPSYVRVKTHCLEQQVRLIRMFFLYLPTNIFGKSLLILQDICFFMWCIYFFFLSDSIALLAVSSSGGVIASSLVRAAVAGNQGAAERIREIGILSRTGHGGHELG